METQHKLKFTEKLSYGVGDLPEAVNSIIAAFLTMFYTDSIGLTAGAVGTMFLISKLFDGLSDLAAGALIDKTRTKWGKARPWLLWMAIPTGISIALIFYVPQNASPKSQLIYAFLTYNLFTTIMYTITGIARSALLPLMTQNQKDRGSLSTFGMFFGLGATVLGCSVTFPLIFKFGGDTHAWRMVFIIYGVLTTIGLLLSFIWSKEYVVPVETAQQGDKAAKISFAEGLKLYFSNKYLIVALIMTVLINLATQLPQNSQTYFYTYSMGDPMLTTSLNLVGLVPMLFSIVFLTGPALGKFGKKNCMYIGAGGQIAAHLLKGIAGMTGSIPLLAAFTAIGNLFVGLLAVPVATLFADGIDYGEWKSNRRIDGMGASVTSFSQKLSSGLAAASVGWVLALTGYAANAVQSSITNTGIICLYSFAPALVLIVAMLIFKATYHYDEIEQQVVSDLQERKAKSE